MAANKINLQEKFSRFQELWTPKIIAELNGQHVKIAKVRGEFVWHKHDNEDELFMVIHGKLIVRFHDKEIELGPGELLTVPRGVEHQTAAKEETYLLMVEPVATVNTGDANDNRCVEELEWL